MNSREREADRAAESVRARLVGQRVHGVVRVGDDGEQLRIETEDGRWVLLVPGDHVFGVIVPAEAGE